MTIQIIGPTQVALYEIATYTIVTNPGDVITWSVVGGDIIAGQGTGTLTVRWTVCGQGSVSVDVIRPTGSQDHGIVVVDVDQN